MWAFNDGVMTAVVQPTSQAYRFIVPKPVRTGIGNVGHNLTYPVRLLNNLLQGRWSGARDESYRFVCNTTVGVGGFLDVATKWKVPQSDADFGQTLGRWGWKPGCFLMLPFLGPSSERDTLGWAADTAANPLLYITPYEFVANQPLTYLGPYSYVAYAVKYNDLTDTVGEYVRFSQAEMDPYSTVHAAWTFARDTRVADMQVTGPQDSASLDTLESAFIACEDPEFPGRGKARSVLIPATGRKLPFTFWLQPGEAPVVYIVPGLGSHRLAQPPVALAELVYQNGFSAVCLSSAFNSEFMEHAATAAVPGNLPVDGHDVHVALTEVDRRLRVLFPRRLGGKALMGYSMGAFHALFIAASEPTNQSPLIAFDRYVAINTPVRMAHGVSKLDEFYRAPLDWPGAERTGRMENTFLKVASLSQHPLPPQTSLPFSAIESRFLIGLTFRLILRDVIYSSQRRHNQGVLQRRTKHLRRLPVYQEILHYSYQDYFEAFVIPYYQARGPASPTAETLEHSGDLRTYAAGLRANPNISIIVNQNDFLLADEDLTWLQSTFTSQTLTVFDQGGHLGNLFTPAVRSSILRSLASLRPPPEASE
jgi:ABC-type transporter lipoprotein component MlaA